jgi:photosystem II stability/assembly factor-like uncharacterized protein
MNALLCALLLSAPLYSELRWRPIGPIRGGRTKAAAGVPQKPGTFYMGAVNGGVFRTDDYGRTWMPLFDDQPSGSIGALAVAPSDPETIYVGSGEGLQRPDLSTGDGVYRSNDGGRSWKHLGLRDGQQIPQIAVDPKDARKLFVAVLGHPYGPNQERGLFRSLDGGESFEKVLYVDEDTGAVDVVIDPQNSQNVYSTLWEARQAPWENGKWSGPGSGFYKSADGGAHFRKAGKGLPDFEHQQLGRIGITVAPSMPSRLYATVQTGDQGRLWRSDDSGETFVQINDDPRPAERADDFAEVKVDPKNPDVVYTASVVVWRSADGGKTFSAFRGAPGGDDYHRLYIDSANPRVIMIAGDQGAIITVNEGESWSSWYNQPTAQMYHLTADNAFPYRLCGGQQESGSACVSSRGPDGAITFREWHPAGFEEYGYAAPDPRDPDLVYGAKVMRWDRRTGDLQTISPQAVRGPDYRVVRTQPLVFSPVDSRLLFFASNKVWATRDGGQHWSGISPDLTRKTWTPPPNVGKYAKDAQVTQRGVVYALAPSSKDKNVLWAGTDDGLVHRTTDGGKTWHEVTPKQLVAWAKVSILEAGHFDTRTAYAAINTFRLDDLRPHLLRTHDGGKTWTEITGGLPSTAPSNVIREDPRRKGLLYCGTEEAPWVSFDDGDHWLPLRLNLPATSIRDLIVKDDDLAIATHGRGFYILDDRQPLLELTDRIAAEPMHLFTPTQAMRIRFDTNEDTPLPPDEPFSQNPPEGAAIDYLLASEAPLTLEILDSQGQLFRRYTSEDELPDVEDDGNIPRWWIRPPRRPANTPGLHRFIWDLHGAKLATPLLGYPSSAVPHDTPKEPRGPWALPGKYTVRLTQGERTQSQALVLVADPRWKTKPGGLRQQFELSRRIAAALQDCDAALSKVRAARKEHPGDASLTALEGEEEGPEKPAAGGARKRKALDPQPALVPWTARLASLYELLQSTDAAPTPQAAATVEKTLAQTSSLVAKARAIAH